MHVKSALLTCTYPIRCHFRIVAIFTLTLHTIGHTGVFCHACRSRTGHLIEKGIKHMKELMKETNISSRMSAGMVNWGRKYALLFQP